jgi:hypothetical protein
VRSQRTENVEKRQQPEPSALFMTVVTPPPSRETMHEGNGLRLEGVHPKSGPSQNVF